MRVALISHTYVVRANRGKPSALARLPGVELMLVVPKKWRNRDIGQVLHVEAHDGRTPIMATVPAWPSGYGSLFVYSPVFLYRVLRRFKPNLVHLEEEPWSASAAELVIMCRALRVPFTFFTWENTDRVALSPFGPTEGFVLRHAAGAVAGNTGAQDRLSRRGFRKSIIVLPQLGVDLDLFKPAWQRSTDRPASIGYVGRLVPEKGLLVLLDALSKVSRRARLILVGIGPLRDTILKRVRALGLDSRVELHEGVPHRDVPLYLHQMSLLVLPSVSTPKWKEQFGHVLIEAMACGVPVIGSNSGAIPEVIGDAGLMVPEGDSAALAGAIDRLIAAPELRSSLIERGRARVTSQFADQAIASRLAEFFRSVATDV